MLKSIEGFCVNKEFEIEQEKNARKDYKFISSCSNLQSKTYKPAISAFFDRD
jgi:hypothetical protein